MRLLSLVSTIFFGAAAAAASISEDEEAEVIAAAALESGGSTFILREMSLYPMVRIYLRAAWPQIY